MNILGLSKDELELAKKEIHQRIQSLEENSKNKFLEIEKSIQHKATDSETEAKSAATNAIAHETQIRELAERIGSSLEEIDRCKTIATTESTNIKKQHEEIKEKNIELLKIIQNLQTQHETTSTSISTLETKINSTNTNIANLEKQLAKQELLSAQIDSISELSTKASSLYSDLTAIQDNALKRRATIEQIFLDINGREFKAEDGSVQREPGLRDSLEKTYEELSIKIEQLDSATAEEIKKITENHETSLATLIENFEKLINDSKSRVDTVDNELKALLPGSLAAGLSAAYEAKTTNEVEAQKEYATNFRNSIYAMIAISLIPFSVDAYLLIEKGMDIISVINNTPKLILSIFPLYLPILWFAYSSNKKLNLSKRLIEEYTHKAVLGKTFSGLSNQIENLPHEASVKEELRTRLLFNLLQVSAENPGKLITDYNKTDHPFMEALEKSAKLSETVESLAKLPGFSALAEKLAAKSQKIINEQTQKVQQGLEIQDELTKQNPTQNK